MMIWPTKSPAEALDYVFDFGAGDEPALQPGEAIFSASVVATGVTLDSFAHAETSVQVRLSGGAAGTVASVSCMIITNAAPPRTFSELAVLEIGAEAISLATVKAALRIDGNDEDPLTAAYIRAAVGHIERVTGRKLTPKIITQTIDSFPHLHQHRLFVYPSSSRPIWLLNGPVSQVLSIAYDDLDGVEQSLTEWRLVDNAVGGRLLPAYGQCWPRTAHSDGAVRLTYVAGYDPTALPADLVLAVIMLVGHFYTNREAVNADTRAAAVELPLGVAALVEPYRLF